MASFISPEGKITRVKNIRKFAEEIGLTYGGLLKLSAGFLFTYRGWCSTHPKARKRRIAFTTALRNTKTGEWAIIGQYVNRFARARGLCSNELSLLRNGHKICYRDWILESTYQ